MANKRNRRNTSRKGLRGVWGGVKLACKVFLGLTTLMAGSVGFIFAYDLVTQSDAFRATDIDIRGLHRAPKTDILQLAELKSSVNIFAVNHFLIEKQLRCHEWIAAAEVSVIPPHTIRIQITEHVPIAVILLDGKRYIMNRQGHIFKEVSPDEPLALPEIEGLSCMDIYMPGTRRTVPFKAVMDALRLGKRTQGVFSSRMIKKIQVDRDIGLTIYTSVRDLAVNIGYGHYFQKYRQLEQVLNYLTKREAFSGVHSIDLKDVNRIVVGPVRKTNGEKEG